MSDYYVGRASASNGMLVLESRQAFTEALQLIPADKCADLEIRVSTPRRAKTDDQLAYWFAVPVPLLALHCGYTPRQMHYALLGECFGYRHGLRGLVVPNVPSIADCTIEQVSQLIDWVLTWAPTEIGVIVPEPDKDWRARRRAAGGSNGAAR